MPSNPLVNWYRGLPPQTRQVVLVGGAAAAGVIVLRSRGGSAPAEPDASGAGSVDGYALGGPALPVDFSNDALGVDQLLEFESRYAKDLAETMEKVDTYLDGPHGATKIPGQVLNTYVQTVNGKGESPNQIAIRLRNSGQRTASNQDITAAYLIRFNGWKTAATAPRWPGENVRY